MAKLIVINANCAKRKVERGIRQTEVEDHAVQAIGDIVSYKEDHEELSITEKDIFDEIIVEGFTIQELKEVLFVPYRGGLGPDKKIDPWEWFDETSGRWKKIDKTPKHKRSIANLSQGDKNKLARSNVSKQDKIDILKGLKNKFKDYPENLLEITIQ